MLKDDSVVVSFTSLTEDQSSHVKLTMFRSVVVEVAASRTESRLFMQQQ